MMAIQNRQEQGLHPTTTRQDMGGVRRAEGIDERRHIELAYYPEHQRQVGHGTDLLNRDRHEAPLLQVFSEVVHHSRCRREDRGRRQAGSKNPLIRPLPLEPGAIHYTTVYKVFAKWADD